MFAIVYDEYVATVDTAKLIDAIDMADCVPHGEVYQIVNGCLERCAVFGPWHKPDDPLAIRVEDATGNVLAEGYGTDH